MNVWGWIFVAPVLVLVVASPITLPLLLVGAAGYGALLWLLSKAIGPKQPK